MKKMQIWNHLKLQFQILCQLTLLPQAAVLTSFSTWQLILTLLCFLPWASRNVCAAAHWTRSGNQSELKQSFFFFFLINFNLDQILNLVHRRIAWARKGCWPVRKEGWNANSCNINTILNCGSKFILSHSCCSNFCTEFWNLLFKLNSLI